MFTPVSEAVNFDPVALFFFIYFNNKKYLDGDTILGSPKTQTKCDVYNHVQETLLTGPPGVIKISCPDLLLSVSLFP